MQYLAVHRSSSLRGEVAMPRSKTHSFRALILASLADGDSIIRNPKLSSDWHEAVKAMRMYGATIEERENNIFRVRGVAGKLQTPEDIVNRRGFEFPQGYLKLVLERNPSNDENRNKNGRSSESQERRDKASMHEQRQDRRMLREVA